MFFDGNMTGWVASHIAVLLIYITGHVASCITSYVVIRSSKVTGVDWLQCCIFVFYNWSHCASP